MLEPTCNLLPDLTPSWLDKKSDQVKSSSSSSLRCSSIMVAGSHAVPRSNKGGRRSLMKELRARAYIASRCWRIHGDE
ncbi:unnamed protein product [Musa textilis]